MEYVGSLSSSKVSEKQRRAAFAAMREGKWKRSVVGFAPGFFRQTIRKLRSGQVARIKKTVRRYFKAGIGFVPDGSRAKNEEEGQKRSKDK
jgi:hypothetical protein